MLRASSERGDQPVPDRKRREQRDLLRADRRHERLERVGSERRTKAGERRDEPREDGLRGRERGEGVEVELEPEQLADDGLGPRVERFHPHAAVGRLDPHLASVDDAVQAAFTPEVREVGPERAVALGRELEVVGRRNKKKRHALTVRVRPRVRPPV